MKRSRLITVPFAHRHFRATRSDENPSTQYNWNTVSTDGAFSGASTSSFCSNANALCANSSLVAAVCDLRTSAPSSILNSPHPAFRPPHSEINEAPDHTGAWRGVFLDGPQSDQNHDDDEVPVWFVYVGEEAAEPTDTVYKCHDFQAAEHLAKRMSHDRRLELIHEGSPA